MKPDYEESIENEDNIASDELLYMEEMEQARIIEQAALAEIELEMAAYPEPDADVPEEEATEAASRTMLKTGASCTGSFKTGRWCENRRRF